MLFEQNSTRMNLVQKFVLEMYYAKTQYKLFEQKFYQECTRKKPTTSYLNKKSTRMNLEQGFLLEMYYAKTQYKSFEHKLYQN